MNQNLYPSSSFTKTIALEAITGGLILEFLSYFQIPNVFRILLDATGGEGWRGVFHDVAQELGNFAVKG